MGRPMRSDQSRRAGTRWWSLGPGPIRSGRSNNLDAFARAHRFTGGTNLLLHT